MAAKCPGGGCITEVALGELTVHSVGEPGHFTLGRVLLGTFCLGVVFGLFLGYLVSWVRSVIRRHHRNGSE